MLLVNAQNFGDSVILLCTGRIVAGEEVAILKKAVLCHQDRKLVVLDLAKVETMDGAGMGLMAFLAGWTGVVGTRLMLTNPSRQVRELLELTNLDSVLDICCGEGLPGPIAHAPAALQSASALAAES